jgi:prepilin-type N-terminal cleavage/methylation domain-containing protein
MVLDHRRPTGHFIRGFSLAECLCALALLSSITTLTLPTLEGLAQRVRVDTVRDRWLGDLDLARSWSLRNGQESQLNRRTGCGVLVDGKDWRCGWQVRAVSSGQLLADSPLGGEVSVVFSSNSGELRVGSRGDPLSGGASLRIKPWQLQWATLATTLCLNIAGRLRVQAGEGCSA